MKNIMKNIMAEIRYSLEFKETENWASETFYCCYAIFSKALTMCRFFKERVEWAET